MPNKNNNSEASAAAAVLGAKGGKNGSGAAKRRDSLHYKVKMARARSVARLKRKVMQYEEESDSSGL